MNLPKTIAIDFDGCICTNDYPYVGTPIWDTIYKARAEQSKGAALILWTCRGGVLLKEAIDACKEWGLFFDAINDNLPSHIEKYGGNSRKIEADEYWDDRAIRIPNT